MPVYVVSLEHVQAFKKSLIDELKTMFLVDQPYQKQWLTPADVCEYLNISARKLRRLRKRGVIPFQKIGNHKYYPANHILRIHPSAYKK